MGRRFLGLLTLMLGACSDTDTQIVSAPTAAQGEYNRIINNDRYSRADANACYAELAQTPEWNILRSKLWASGDSKASPPMSYLANKNRPTEAEVKTLISFSDKIAPCRLKLMNGLSYTNSSLLQVEVNSAAAFDSLMLQLVKRQIAWGDFAKGIDQINKATSEQRVAVYAQIQNRLNVQHSAEMQQRQRQADDAAAGQKVLSDAIGAGLSTWAQQQQQQTKPVFTNCTRTGNMVNCTSF